MVLPTVRRIRQLGMVAGASCVLVGLLLLLLSPADWRIEHINTYASFILLPLTGIVTIIFTRGQDAASVIENAKLAGYEASEEEKKSEKDCLENIGTLYLVIPLAYTIGLILLVYFVLEPSGMLALKGTGGIYLALTWPFPMFLIVFFAIPYSNYKRYPESRILEHKSVEGWRLKRRMRQQGEEDSKSLRIIKEEEAKKEKKKKED